MNDENEYPAEDDNFPPYDVKNWELMGLTIVLASALAAITFLASVMPLILEVLADIFAAINGVLS